MSDKDFNGKDIGKKVKAMEKKTREAQKYFNLPETETVIQDYACAHGAPGRMYITQNYIGFKGGSNIICIQFQKVKSVQKTKLTSIEIEADKTYSFSTFANRIEAYYLLDHLSKNVPSYSKKTERQQLLGNDGGEGGEEGDYSLGFGDMLEMDSQVDTGSTRRALQRLNEAKENGANALNELSRQRDVIDKINNNLDYIEYKLDDNEKNISSMESFGGMMSSAFKGNKKMDDYVTRREHKEIEVKEIKKPELKIDILFKHKNDELTPSTLVLKGQGFVIYKAGTEKLVETKPETAWKYEQVKQAVLRARHQHLDIWFVEGKRVRLMSAHVQAIVNELFLRHPEKSIPVEFEPGVLKFDYGHPSISYSLGKKQSGVSGTGINSTNLISDKVSPQVKKQLAQQDKDIDEMNNGLDTLLGMANAMNTELINSEGQVEEMKRKMENVDYKMGKQQHGLQNILDT